MSPITNTFFLNSGQVATSPTEIPTDKIFVVPVIATTVINKRHSGYGDWVKNDSGTNKIYCFAFSPNPDNPTYANNNNLGTYTNTDTTISSSPSITFTQENTNSSGKNRSWNATEPGTTGIYNITIANSSYTNAVFQVIKGSPSGTFYTSTFTLNLSGVYVGQANTGGGTPYQYNYAPNNNPVWKIGPFEADIEGHIAIALSNQSSITSGSYTTFSGFNASNLSVSITGKTLGTDYTYFVLTNGSPMIGQAPVLVVSGKPNVLGATPTLNITYS